jgi:hypothetical protein
VQRGRELFTLEDIEQSELLATLDPLFDSLKSGPERFPEPSGPPLEYLHEFAGVVCDVIRERGLLGPQHLRKLRMNVLLGCAHAQVHYYRSLVEEQGDGWANGLRRAEEFRALLQEKEPDSRALDSFIQILEKERQSESTGFVVMLYRARAVAEMLRETAA